MPPTTRKAPAEKAPEMPPSATTEPEEPAVGAETPPGDGEATEAAPEGPTHLGELCAFCGVHPIEGHTSFTCQHGSWAKTDGVWSQVA